MCGCCSSSTTLRLISNSGLHISEHGLAVLFDIWNKLYYPRHIKYVWMDHLTGICFKTSHSSALAWLSRYASHKSRVPLASPCLLYLWQSRARAHLHWAVGNSGCEVIFSPLLCGDDQGPDSYRAWTCESLVWEAVHQLCLWPSLSFEFPTTVGLLISLHLVWQGSLCHS